RAHGPSRLPRQRSHLRHARPPRAALGHDQADARAAGGFPAGARGDDAGERRVGREGGDDDPPRRPRRGNARARVDAREAERPGREAAEALPQEVGAGTGPAFVPPRPTLRLIFRGIRHARTRLSKAAHGMSGRTGTCPSTRRVAMTRRDGLAIAWIALFAVSATGRVVAGAETPQAAPASAAAAAAKASPDLVGELSKELSSTPEQAAGAARALFGLAETRLQPAEVPPGSQAAPRLAP